jgi:hypothetical protein
MGPPSERAKGSAALRSPLLEWVLDRVRERVLEREERRLRLRGEADRRRERERLRVRDRLRRCGKVEISIQKPH